MHEQSERSQKLESQLTALRQELARVTALRAEREQELTKYDRRGWVPQFIKFLTSFLLRAHKLSATLRSSLQERDERLHSLQLSHHNLTRQVAQATGRYEDLWREASSLKRQLAKYERERVRESILRGDDDSHICPAFVASPGCKRCHSHDRQPPTPAPHHDQCEWDRMLAVAPRSIPHSDHTTVARHAHVATAAAAVAAVALPATVVPRSPGPTLSTKQLPSFVRLCSGRGERSEARCELKNTKV